jgi:serine/threonine protein kinase
VVAPSAYSSHPNVLPLYGTFTKETSSGRVVFLVSPFIRNGNLHNYALRLPQKSQMLLVSSHPTSWPQNILIYLQILDVIEAIMYLHSLGIVHGNIKGVRTMKHNIKFTCAISWHFLQENILISDEGRALVTDFRPYHINVATAEDGPTGPYVTDTLRFTAPELIKNSRMLPTTKSDIWSIGCLIYLVITSPNLLNYVYWRCEWSCSRGGSRFISIRKMLRYGPLCLEESFRRGPCQQTMGCARLTTCLGTWSPNVVHWSLMIDPRCRRSRNGSLT